MTTARTAPKRRAPLVRTAVAPCMLVGLVTAAIAAAVAGSPGLLGALLGTALVVGFFGSGQAALVAFRDVSPALLLVVALMSYLLQVVVLLAVFAAFRRNPGWAASVSPTSLGVALLVCTLVWTTGLVVGSRREQIALYDVERDRG